MKYHVELKGQIIGTIKMEIEISVGETITINQSDYKVIERKIQIDSIMLMVREKVAEGVYHIS